MICMKSSYNAFHIIQYMKFTALMKKVFLDVKEIAHIDNKKYNNKIAKISIGEYKNDIKVKIEENNNEHIHLFLRPIKQKVNVSVTNCNKVNIDIGSKINDLTLSLKSSSITIDKDINLPKLSLSFIKCTDSSINIKKISSLQKLKIKESNNNNYTIQKISTKSFEFYLNEKDNLNCSLLKLTDNSILDYKSKEKTTLKINQVALYTLINVFDVKQNKFINLPLGVLGGKIGSTSFPTLIINYKDKVNISDFKEKLFSSNFFTNRNLLWIISGLILCSYGYRRYKYSNEDYSKYKVCRTHFKKVIKNKIH